MEKSCKIRSCHFTCMAGMVQSCNHVAAALYRIEAVLKNGWLILPVPAQQINGFQTTRTFNQWKLNTWTLVMKNFVSEGRKNDHLCRHQRKNIIPLVNKGIPKCLHWMILLRVWRMFFLKRYCFQPFQGQMLILLQILHSVY